MRARYPRSPEQALAYFLGFDPALALRIAADDRPVRYLPPWCHPADYEFEGFSGEEFLDPEDRPTHRRVGTSRSGFPIFEQSRPPLKLPPGAPHEQPAGYKPRLGWHKLYELQLFIRLACPPQKKAPKRKSEQEKLLNRRDRLRSDLESFLRGARGRVWNAFKEVRLPHGPSGSTDEARLLATYLGLRALHAHESQLDYHIEMGTFEVEPLSSQLQLILNAKFGRATTSLVLQAFRVHLPDFKASEVAMVAALEKGHCGLSADHLCFFTNAKRAMDAWGKLMTPARRAARAKSAKHRKAI